MKFKPIALPSVAKIVVTQCVIAVVVTIAAAAVQGSEAILSAIVGSALVIVPNAFFARRFFRASGARMAAAVTRNFYRAEAEKFILTAIGFAVVFSTLKSIDVVVLFASYITVMIAGWIASVRTSVQQF